jgi:hypothetical protein
MNLILAQVVESLHKTLWYPTILGVLVVVVAVTLFCGSVYLLLATNLGARLGFLVAFTGLMGFLVLLSTMWITTASPLNTLKGRPASWKVQEIVSDPSGAKISAVHDIANKKNKVDTTEAANVKAAVDAAIVTKVATPTVKVLPQDNRFAKFDSVTNYMVLETYEIGGSNPQFWKGQFTHTPHYAAVQFCEVKDTSTAQPFGLPPLPPECDPNGQKGYVILQRDLGSLRVPPFVAWFSFIILFVLGLLMLHWRERDEQDAEKAKEEAARPTPAPEPAPVPSGV